jgi:hydrogenase maturation protease
LSAPRILVACIGNIFLGDDGFGTEVARRLANCALPPTVVLKDFGIRSFDLAYALLEQNDLVILVDACQRGGEPGTIYLIEADVIPTDAQPSRLEGHSMSPASVLRMVHSMGGTPGRILIVGCEPADLGSDEEGKLGLSDIVMVAVDEAVAVVEMQIAKAFEETAVAAR